jgi:hypothetical protein
MEHQSDCPLCRTKLTTKDLYPNFQCKLQTTCIVFNIEMIIVNRLAEYRIKALKEPPQATQLPSSRDPSSIETVIQANTQNPTYIANTLANWLPYEGKRLLTKA